MTDVRPVARLLRPLTSTLVVLFLLMAGIGIAGLLAVDRAFGELTGDIEPAADANRALMGDMVDMETGVRAWAQSGLSSGLRPYRAAQATYPGRRAVLREYAAGADEELRRAVAVQDRAIEGWLVEHARPVTGRPGGPSTFDARVFVAGSALFDDLRDANAVIEQLFTVRLDDARTRADRWLRGTLLVLLLLTVAAVVAITHVRTRVVAELQEPLVELGNVVHGLSAGRVGVRAVLDRGPVELRAIAQSINELAESNDRARAVEQQVGAEIHRLETAKSDFVSNVSHELRTPLTTIGGYLELVGDEFDGVMADRHRRMYDATRRNVARLNDLVEDLLILSRAEDRASTAEELDVLVLAQECVTDLRMTAARRDIRVVLSTPGSSSDGPQHVVLGDGPMLTRVLLNLMSNAVKFSREGGTVEVTVTRQEDDVVVAVRDHGIGIPADELDQLGGRFFRASNAIDQQVSGTGLGLRIVQTIVEKHGGALAIESVVDEGTTAAVRLPRHC